MRKPSPLHYYDIAAIMDAMNLRNERPHWRSDGAGGGGGGSSIPPNINWHTSPSYPGRAADMSVPPPPTSGGSWPSNPYQISGQPLPGGGVPGVPYGGPSTPMQGIVNIRKTGTGGRMGDPLAGDEYLRQLFMLMQNGGY